MKLVGVPNHIDASNSRLVVKTYRQGSLAAVGHDLHIVARRFRIDVSDDQSQVSGVVELSELAVEAAVKNDVPVASLSDNDKEKIDSAMRRTVLETAKHPRATFTSTVVQEQAGHTTIRGDLQLHGVSQRIDIQGVREGRELVCRFAIKQSTFGLQPFQILMGALKVADEVNVELRVSLSRD